MRHLHTAIAVFLTIFGPLTAMAQQETYSLLDGRVVSGEPISYTEAGVVLRSGTTVMDRIPWPEFTQDSLKKLAAEAPNPRDSALVELYIDDIVEARRKQEHLEVREVPHPQRPAGSTGFFQLFTSPLGLLLLLLMYGANIYAAFEVALYRNQPTGLVCGVAAAAPVIGPAVFLAMPTRRYAVVQETAPAHPPEEVLIAHEEDYAQSEAEAAAGAQEVKHAEPAPPKLPPAITFARGEFTFNRRFFETKMPGFLRLVPGEAEKDMVLLVKSARGDFTGRRITELTQTDLHLQTFRGNATATEVIPFIEIREVQVKHKDAP